MPLDQNLREPTRSTWAAALTGIGMMAAVDEIIFHQVLAWHHFYDLSTPAIGLLSDGLLHAAELIAIVAGFFVLLDLRRRNALAAAWAWAGFFLGAGGFQLFDGLVNHKVLRLHQIRYGVYLLPYDIAWNLFGLTLIVIGVVLAFRVRPVSQTRTASSSENVA
ncbi:MAG: DUF2243 domain-containing protein [Chloroflexi bacterium]|nr:MAG: DUF2243 domain-containing protein [Chloroflexota bacterium]